MRPQSKVRAASHSETRAAVPSAVLQLDADQLLKWAMGIARGVCRDARFRSGSAEEEELEGVAIECLVEYIHRYDENQLRDGDVMQHFKRWASGEVRKRCRRHAEKLRNGGTYKTTDDTAVKERTRVRSLPMCCDCSDVALPWPERDDDDPDEVSCQYEPKLVIINTAKAPNPGA